MMENEGDQIKRHTIEVIKFLTDTAPVDELIQFVPKFIESDYDFLDGIEGVEDIQEALMGMTMESAHNLHIYVGCPEEPNVSQINLALFGMMIYGDELRAMLFFRDE